MRRRRLTRGQSLTEFALILPILAMIMIGAIDLGRAYYIKVTLANAVRVGAEYAVDPMRWTEYAQNNTDGKNKFLADNPGVTDPCVSSGPSKDTDDACGKKRATVTARNLVVMEAKNLGITLNDVAIYLASTPSSSFSSSFYKGSATWTGDSLTWTPNGQYSFSVRAKFSPVTPGVRALFGGSDPTFHHDVRLRHNCLSSGSCTWNTTI